MAIAVSAPIIIAGLVAAALADSWTLRAGGAVMVAGASTALALTDPHWRRLSWGLAAVGGLVILTGCF